MKLIAKLALKTLKKGICFYKTHLLLSSLHFFPFPKLYQRVLSQQLLVSRLVVVYTNILRIFATHSEAQPIQAGPRVK